MRTVGVEVYGGGVSDSVLHASMLMEVPASLHHRQQSSEIQAEPGTSLCILTCILMLIGVSLHSSMLTCLNKKKPARNPVLNYPPTPKLLNLANGFYGLIPLYVKGCGKKGNKTACFALRMSL